MGENLVFLFLVLWVVVIFLGIIIGSFVFWIWTIIDIAKRKFKNDNDRIIWILIVIFLGILGSIIYYFAYYLPNKKKK